MRAGEIFRGATGLSLGVIVVEAARRSGSLITARFAADQGRDVFAVPGSPLDPRAEGTNDLLRDGASFCASVDDILQTLSDQRTRDQRDLFSEPGRRDDETFWDEMSFSEQMPPGKEQPPPIDLETATPPSSNTSDVPHVAQVVEGLGPVPVSLDELARCTGLPIQDIRTALLELEIAGRIERHGGSLISLIMG